MSNMSVKHVIRRGSSRKVPRSIEIGDVDENSDSDEESVDDRASVTNSSQIGGDIVNIPASTVANHALEKLVIENNIFLKAALQLLDQRDHSISKTKSLKEASSMDVIMCGKLRKASNGTMSRVWKDKYVELRHGVLSYEDIIGWSEKTNRKTVQLIAGHVTCRPSLKYHGHVFEIRDLDSEGHVVHHHSRKKLFMTESKEDMVNWIESIRTAMIGSAGDFEPTVDSKSASGGEDSHTVRSDESEFRVSGQEDWRPLHTSQMSQIDEEDSNKQSSVLPKLFSSNRKVKKGSRGTTASSDCADTFSNEMKRFEYIKRIIHDANSPQAYQECLRDQCLDRVLTIPVAYMKKFLKQSTMGNYSMQTTGSARKTDLEKREEKLKRKAKKKQGKKIRRSVFGGSEKEQNKDDHNMHWNRISKPTSIENSQAWKDLFRDTININGDLVNGGVEGPEAMIGALVRHILLQVQIMREKWVSFQESERDSTVSVSSTPSEQEMSLERARALASTYADLDEGQALSIARDILLSCNRTESGGDTYYCTQALLCNNQFAVLTPHACDVEPIEVVVDVVESAKRRSANRTQIQRDENSAIATKDSSSAPENGTYIQHLAGIIENSPRNVDDQKETFVTYPDSTTEETDTRSENSSELNVSSSPHSHYPDEVLTAAAAQVRKVGRHIGDIEDYYDPAQVVLKSDIPGASAIPSNMLLMKEISKQKKRLSQPGYRDRSDSENSIDSNSGDSKSFSSEKDVECEKQKTPVDLKTMYDTGNNVTTADSNYVTPATTPVFHINLDDDVTVAVSDITMDSVPSKVHPRRNTSLSAVLKKNFGLSTDIPQSPPPTQKKRHSFFSSWSNTKGDDMSTGSPGGLFTSPHHEKTSHSSWRSAKSYGNTTDDDASSVTGNQRSQRHHPEDEEETAAQAMCIRIQVIVKSRYRLCNLDPQDEHEDTWANITGQFHQHFFLKSNSNGRPAVSDRFVTVKVDDPSLKY